MKIVTIFFLIITISLASSRFTRVGDTLLDSSTNLMWQDSSAVKNNKKNWQNAKKYCQELTLGGYNNWRLPSIDELKSIVDYSRYNPAIFKSFKHIKSDYYWSSSSNVDDSSDAWIVGFEYGNDDFGAKSDTNLVRCTRQ